MGPSSSAELQGLLPFRPKEFGSSSIPHPLKKHIADCAVAGERLTISAKDADHTNLSRSIVAL